MIDEGNREGLEIAMGLSLPSRRVIRSRRARRRAYLAVRRSMGFDLRIAGRQLGAFARFADQTGHRGPLTVAVAVRWAQSARRATRLTWARRIQTLRPFMTYRAQFETGTEIAPSGLFGPVILRNIRF